MRAYVYETKLATGEHIDLVYESNCKSGSVGNWVDMRNACERKGVELDKDEMYRSAMTIVYVLNKKNAYDQCFGDLRIIDTRK